MKTASVYLLTILVLGLVANPALLHVAQYQDGSNMFGTNAFAESEDGHDQKETKGHEDTNDHSQDESDDKSKETDHEDDTNDHSQDESDDKSKETDHEDDTDDHSQDESRNKSEDALDKVSDDLDNHGNVTSQDVVQKSDALVLKLEQKIDQLEKRLQTLLEKLQTGQYYGDISQPDSEIKSYTISFDGTATSLSNDSIQNVTAKFVIENLSTKDYISTFKVTGGQLQIGQTTYDLAFGKMRILSDHAKKDSILLIGNLIDEQGNNNGIRLSIDSAQSLDGDFGQQPIDLTVRQPSKIAGQWVLDGNGKLSLS